MDLPDDLTLFHQPVRLRIMGLLYKHRDVRFTGVRDALGLSDGNLASHAKRLQDAGHVEGRKVLTKDGFEMRYKITRSGSEAFRRYLHALRGFIEDVAEPAPHEDDQQDRARQDERSQTDSEAADQALPGPPNLQKGDPHRTARPQE